MVVIVLKSPCMQKVRNMLYIKRILLGIFLFSKIGFCQYGAPQILDSVGQIMWFNDLTGHCTWVWNSVTLTLYAPCLTGGSGAPAPPNTSLQFNNSGAFGGNANLTYISPTTSSIGLNGMVQNGPGLSVAPFSTLPSPWNTMSQYLVPLSGNNYTNEFIISPNPNYSSGAINILTGSTGAASGYQTSSITTYNWATNDIGGGLADQAYGLVTYGLANPPNNNGETEVIGVQTFCGNINITYNAGSCVGLEVLPNGPGATGKFNYVYGLQIEPQEAAIATYGIHVGFGSPAHAADRALWIQGPTQLGGTVQVEQYLYVNTEASGGYLFGGNYYSLFVANLNNTVVTPIVSIGTVQNQYHTADRAFLSSGTALSEFDGGIMQPLVTPSDVGPCIAGQIQLDASYIYVCTATNVYKRAALSSF